MDIINVRSSFGTKPAGKSIKGTLNCFLYCMALLLTRAIDFSW